jgi:hypothetical protein
MARPKMDTDATENLGCLKTAVKVTVAEWRMWVPELSR